MAVNKNFVVKNGLEVDTNTLFVDSQNNRVAIGTTVPTASLDVRGKILSDSEIETWNARVVGIVTAGAVGVTTLTATDATVTGFSTLGYANASSLNVTTGFSTFQGASVLDFTVAIGATVSGDLNVGAAATVGAALTVTGASKFAEFVRFEKDIAVGSAATVGVLTVTNSAYIGGDLVVAGDINLDEFTGRNLNVTGIATIGFLTATNAYVSGVGTVVNLNSTIATVGFVTATDLFVSGVTTSATKLNVGLAGTMMTVVGTGNSARVGISSADPQYVLDVNGDINSSTAVRINGTNVVDLVSGDATALAIALG
jgi:hypothetical protein